MLGEEISSAGSIPIYSFHASHGTVQLEFTNE